jgi:hypothetical protein
VTAFIATRRILFILQRDALELPHPGALMFDVGNVFLLVAGTAGTVCVLAIHASA